MKPTVAGIRRPCGAAVEFSTLPTLVWGRFASCPYVLRSAIKCLGGAGSNSAVLPGVQRELTYFRPCVTQPRIGPCPEPRARQVARRYAQSLHPRQYMRHPRIQGSSRATTTNHKNRPVSTNATVARQAACVAALPIPMHESAVIDHDYRDLVFRTGRRSSRIRPALRCFSSRTRSEKPHRNPSADGYLCATCWNGATRVKVD